MRRTKETAAERVLRKLGDVENAERLRKLGAKKAPQPGLEPVWTFRDGSKLAVRFGKLHRV